MTEFQEMTVRELLVALTAVEDEIRESKRTPVSAQVLVPAEAPPAPDVRLTELDALAQRIVDELHSRPPEQPAGEAAAEPRTRTSLWAARSPLAPG